VGAPAAGGTPGPEGAVAGFREPASPEQLEGREPQGAEIRGRNGRGRPTPHKKSCGLLRHNIADVERKVHGLRYWGDEHRGVRVVISCSFSNVLNKRRASSEFPPLGRALIPDRLFHERFFEPDHLEGLKIHSSFAFAGAA